MKRAVLFTLFLAGLVFAQGAWAKGVKAVNNAKKIINAAEACIQPGSKAAGKLSNIHRIDGALEEVWKIIRRQGKYTDETLDILRSSGRYSDEYLAMLKKTNYIPNHYLPTGVKTLNGAEDIGYKRFTMMDDINDVLAKSERAKNFDPESIAITRGWIENIDDLIDTAEPLYSDLTVYSNSAISRPIRELLEISGGDPQVLIGKTISDNSFISVSHRADRAASYGKEWNRELFLPKGTHKKNIDRSLFPYFDAGDGEILSDGFDMLLPRRKQFQIIDAYYDADGVLQTVEKALPPARLPL